MPFYSIHSSYPSSDTYSLYSNDGVGEAKLIASSVNSAYVGTVIAAYNYGTLKTKLLGPENYRGYDFENSITAIFNKALPSFTTKESYFAYRFLIGEELVVVRYIEDLGNNRYILSGFSRDRLGYYPAAFESHIRLGERITYIDSSVGYSAKATNTQSLFFATSNNNPGNKSKGVLTVVQNPNRLCMPPTNVVGERSGNNLVITFSRRDRSDNSWATAGEPFLSESQEKYGIDIFNSENTLVRTKTVLDTSTITYTEAEQISDFTAVQSNYIINIFQYNSLDEKGYETVLNYDDSKLYFNDMEAETIGVQLSNSTKTWDTTNVTYNVIAGKYLDIVQSSTGNKALKLDGKSNIRNAEILIKFRIPVTGGFSTVFRGKDDVSGLVFNINSALTSIKYSEYTAGVEGTVIGTKSINIEANLWYFLKLKVFENCVYAKLWKYHMYEPKDWNLVETFTPSRYSGWIGLAQQVNTSETEIDNILVKVL